MSIYDVPLLVDVIDPPRDAAHRSRDQATLQPCDEPTRPTNIGHPMPIRFGRRAAGVPPAPQLSHSVPCLRQLVELHERQTEPAVRPAQPGEPGRRSPDWIKTPLERTTEAIIVGWRPGAGRREGMIGALVLGAYDDQGRLVHIGDVGTVMSTVPVSQAGASRSHR